MPRRPQLRVTLDVPLPADGAELARAAAYGRRLGHALVRAFGPPARAPLVVPPALAPRRAPPAAEEAPAGATEVLDHQHRVIGRI